MKGCGIVCEYNPFHNGHAYHIARAKQDSGLPVICVMSGDFVQRGELALFDKYTRARWALDAGADLVLELPYPFSCASAEIFAKSALHIMSATGLCEAVSFGCVCGEKELFALSEILDSDFEKKARALQKEQKNISYAAAREKIACQMLGKEYADIMKEPNNILALEYIKAAKNMGIKLDFYPVKRIGAKHSDTLPENEFASASYIRANLDKSKGLVPPYVFKDTASKKLVDKALFSAAVLSKLSLTEKEKLKQCAEISGGLEYSIIKYARESTGIDELYEKLKCKHLTDAKIRRAILYAFLGTTKENMKQMPEYTNVLAFSDLGAKLIKSARAESKIRILSKISDIKQANEQAKAQLEKAQCARDVFEKFLSV